MFPIDRFTENLKNVLATAKKIADFYETDYIGSEHILFAILNLPETRACKILCECGVQEAAYRKRFVSALDKNTGINGYTARTKDMMNKAYEFAVDHDGDGVLVGTEYMLLAILLDDDSVAVRHLRRMHVNVEEILSKIDAEIGETKPDPAMEEYFDSLMFSKNRRPAQKEARQGTRSTVEIPYGTDLTQRRARASWTPSSAGERRSTKSCRSFPAAPKTTLCWWASRASARAPSSKGLRRRSSAETCPTSFRTRRCFPSICPGCWQGRVTAATLKSA